METMKDFLDTEKNEFKHEPYSEDFWAKVQHHIEQGDVLTGKVVAMGSNGLFVDYDGIRAFMPSSMISIKRVESFEKYLDNDISYVIVECTPKRKRIVISHKIIEMAQRKQEISEIRMNIKVGDIFEAKVDKITDYGAFIDLGNHIHGLCHISQLSHERVKNVESVLSKGEVVKVKVIKNVDGKISLSIKALLKPPARPSAYTDENNEQIDISKVKLPTGEASTSLSDILKNIKL